MLSFLLIAAGFAGLMLGGNLLVQGAVEIAQRLRVSPLIIGLTLVGFGTSMPELVTSVQAAFAGSPGIAIGNIVGSNIANILLILGIAALLFPIDVPRAALLRDGSVLVAVTAASILIVLSGDVSRPVGFALLAGLLVYLLFVLRGSRGEEEIPLGDIAERPIWLSSVVMIGGLLLTIGAARMLIVGATDVARAFEVSEAMIGLTIVAVGTSLPELVTSVIAALKRQSDVAVGNIIGSNIFNLLGILGATAALKPIEVPASFAALDIWVMAGATALLILFGRTGWRIGRVEGALLGTLYLAYVTVLAVTA